MTPREMFDRFYALLNAGDLDGAMKLLHPEFVEDYPQSGERVRGTANLRAILENYPGGMDFATIKDLAYHGSGEEWAIAPNYQVVRVTDSENTGTGVLNIRYPDGSVWWVVVLFELKDDLIYHQTAFFAQPFEAPEWRNQWVEQITHERT